MNVSAEELMKFERLGAMWRDPRGPMRVLHVMNPLRTRWIAEVGQKHFRVGSLARMRILDVGCGAGLLSESLAAPGEGFRTPAIAGRGSWRGPAYGNRPCTNPRAARNAPMGF